MQDIFSYKLKSGVTDSKKITLCRLSHASIKQWVRHDMAGRSNNDYDYCKCRQLKPQGDQKGHLYVFVQPYPSNAGLYLRSTQCDVLKVTFTTSIVMWAHFLFDSAVTQGGRTEWMNTKLIKQTVKMP